MRSVKFERNGNIRGYAAVDHGVDVGRHGAAPHRNRKPSAGSKPAHERSCSIPNVDVFFPDFEGRFSAYLRVAVLRAIDERSCEYINMISVLHVGMILGRAYR